MELDILMLAATLLFPHLAGIVFIAYLTVQTLINCLVDKDFIKWFWCFEWFSGVGSDPFVPAHQSQLDKAPHRP